MPVWGSAPHCSCMAEDGPMLDWLDVEMGDMLSSVSGGVDRPGPS